MPKFRVCIEPGCAELVAEGNRCPVHRQGRAIDTRPSASQRGYDRRWRSKSLAYRRSHPVCEQEGGCSLPSAEVDHVDGLGPLGPRGYDDTNLQALCKPHHSSKTASDHGGWAHVPWRHTG